MSNIPTPTLQKRNLNWCASVLKIQFFIVNSTQHLQTHPFYAIPYHIHIKFNHNYCLQSFQIYKWNKHMAWLPFEGSKALHLLVLQAPELVICFDATLNIIQTKSNANSESLFWKSTRNSQEISITLIFWVRYCIIVWSMTVFSEEKMK